MGGFGRDAKREEENNAEGKDMAAAMPPPVSDSYVHGYFGMLIDLEKRSAEPACNIQLKVLARLCDKSMTLL